jgi:ATP dependent DNA ligase-like protein
MICSECAYAGRAERVRASFASDSILELRGSGDLQMPVSQSSRIGKGQMGRGADRPRHHKRCRYLKPQLVAAIEFLGWTPEARLRHPKFVSLRNDKRAAHVIRVGAQGEGIFRL